MTPVIVEPNRMFVRTGAGQERTLIRDGSPIAISRYGIIGVYGLFEGLSCPLLELVYSSGQIAIWIFDQKLTFLSENLNDLSDDQATELKRSLMEAANGLWSRVVAGALNAPDPRLNGLTTVSRSVLWSYYRPRAPAVEYFYKRQHIALATHYETAYTDNSKLLSIAPNALNLIGLSFAHVAREACETGYLTFPSPYSGIPCSSDLALAPDVVLYWYKFTDKLVGKDFWIVSGAIDARVVAVFLPEDAYVLMLSIPERTYFESQYSQTICDFLLQHLFFASEKLNSYLSRESRTMVLVAENEHLAHHLWNELAGLDILMGSEPPQSLPFLYQISSRSEMFGKIEEIFPDIDGKVIRYFDCRSKWIELLYESGSYPVRVTSIHVTNRLRERLAKAYRKFGGLSQDFQEIDKLDSRRTFIVALMVRLENRTAVNLEEAYKAVIGHIVRKLGSVFFVFDGRTSAGGDLFDARVQREAAFCARLAAEADLLGCGSITNVGKPLCSNVIWLDSAAFFISPWGAGLAKSRWATNRPGIIFTSRRNLGHHDLHIYNNDCSEQPAALFIIPLDGVRDLTGSAGTDDCNKEFNDNFWLDTETVLRFVDRLIAYLF